MTNLTPKQGPQSMTKMEVMILNGPLEKVRKKATEMQKGGWDWNKRVLTYTSLGFSTATLTRMVYGYEEDLHE